MKVFNFLKTYWLFVLLGAMAIIVSALKIFTPGPPAVPLPIPTISPAPALLQVSPPTLAGKSLPKNVKFSADTTPLPRELKVYRGTPGKFSEEGAAMIAKEFGFANPSRKSEDISLGTFLFWASDEYSLLIGLDSPKIDYSFDLSQNPYPKEGVLSTPEQARGTLNNLLDKLELKPSLGVTPQETKYLKLKTGGLTETTPEEADFIQVGLTPSLGNYQLLGNSPSQSLISFILGKNKKIIHFQYRIYFLEFLEKNNFPLKNQGQILDSLPREGKVVEFSLMTEAAWGLDLIEVEFNQISLAYFQPADKNEIIQPIYVLSGNGVLSDGQQTRVVAYLPALQP